MKILENGLTLILTAAALLAGAGIARQHAGSAAKATTLADVPMGEHRVGAYAFAFAISHRPAGKVSVTPLDSSGGRKGSSTYLLEKFSPTYSHRAGYSLSPSAALKMLAAARAGKEYVSPTEARANEAAAISSQRVLDLVVRLGGTIAPDTQTSIGRREGHIDTIYGPLVVMSMNGDVMARFLDHGDAARAGNLRGIAPYVGKWNFHQGPERAPRSMRLTFATTPAAAFERALIAIVSPAQRRGPSPETDAVRAWKVKYPESHAALVRARKAAGDRRKADNQIHARTGAARGSWVGPWDGRSQG